MADSSKLKILYVLEIMKKTDELHPLNTTQIAEQLAYRGITAERKSIVRDLECLEDAGLSIKRCENHNLGWYMTDQEFEDYELKMLADAVAAAKFLTIGDSRRLIGHIKGLATSEGERIIDSTIIMDPSMKIQDKQFKHKFDAIMRAIVEKKQVRFQYVDLAAGNRGRLRKDGKYYQVSPYYMALANEEYFLIGNIAPYDSSVHFRIEMMTNLELTDEPVRPISEIEELARIGHGSSIADYMRETVNMWHGEVTEVKLRGGNGCRHNLMKTFGHDISMHDDGPDAFVATIKVTDGDGFYQWLAGYGPYLEILSPEPMREYYKDYLVRTLQNYTKE